MKGSKHERNSPVAKLRIEEFEIEKGRSVQIKIVEPELDYAGDAYERVYSWLQQVDKFLYRKFRPVDLRLNKNFFFNWIRQKNVKLLIAKHENVIVAQASLEFPVNKYEKNAHVGTLGIAIHPEYQNFGLGKKMFRILEGVATIIGLCKLQIECISRNEQALNLYEKKLGYYREGQRKSTIRLDDGTYCDLILLGKNLKPPEEYISSRQKFGQS